MFRTYLTSKKNEPYVRHTTYPITIMGRNWEVEPVLKVAVPFVAILTQLWWAHGHWRCA